MEFVKLGDICSIKTGKLNADASSSNGKYPFFTCSRKPLKIDNYSYDCECVLVSGNGNLNVKYYNGKFDAYQRTYIIEINNKELFRTKYIYLLLESKLDELRKKSIGGVIKYIKLGDLTSIFVPNISISEQEKIINNIFKLQKTISIKKSQLIKLDELIKSQFVEMFEYFNINSKGWELKTFDEITYLITDGEHATPRRSDNGIYLLSARNVLNHALQLEDVDYIDEEEYKRISKRIIPRAGDVLLSCSGTVGRCCCVPEDLKFQMVRSTAILRFKEDLNPVFAEYMITSDYIQRQIDTAKTTSSQANLFQGEIKKLKCFVPPIDLQNDFVNIVKQIGKQKLSFEKSLKKLEEMLSALMQEYFG